MLKPFMFTTLKYVLNIYVICFHLFNDLYYYVHKSHPFSFLNQFYILMNIQL
jgi:hypothetical protein